MKLCFQLLCIHHQKKITKKAKQRRLKRINHRRKSNYRPNPTTINIPLDLQISTLLRLPVKSLLRFQSVSKLWSSTITSKEFRNWHFDIAASSSPPRLLIAFKDSYDKKLTLVMLPNPKASSCCVPYKDLSLLKVLGKMVNNTVRGLISLRNGVSEGLCNPSTRQLEIFPQLKFKNISGFGPCPKYFFGYDPVEYQYKVLAVDHIYFRAEHKVLVVGGERGWRDVTCVVCPHWAHTKGLYMNGYIYYGAVCETTRINSQNDSIIVSFNVRFETFNIIKVPSKILLTVYDHMWVATPYDNVTDKILINYGGKIAVVENPRQGSFRIWVVEDGEKEEWSMNTYHLPQSAAGFDFKVMETFHNGEICMVSKQFSDPFSLFYYNLRTKSMRSVTIEGLPISKLQQVVMVSDHHENSMSLFV